MGEFGYYESHDIGADDEHKCYSFGMDSISKDFCPTFEALILKHHYWNQDGIVSMVTRVQTWISRVWILREARVLFLFQNIQTSAAAHQSSSRKCMEGSFSRGKVVRVWCWPVTSFQCIYITAPTYLFTYLFTHSMEQRPSWEAKWFSASQEILHILWNLKVHYCIHKSSPPVN